MKFAIFYMYMYIYGLIYTGNNINQIERTPRLLIISSLILSYHHLIKKEFRN